MKKRIDPKDLMAVERSVTSLIGTSISLIVLGFVVEKFELFLHLLGVELKDKSSNIPELKNAIFYNYLGIAIVIGGILLSLYTYRYYTKWIKNLERGYYDTDKNIYFVLSVFIAIIGFILLISMIII